MSAASLTQDMPDPQEFRTVRVGGRLHIIALPGKYPGATRWQHGGGTWRLGGKPAAIDPKNSGPKDSFRAQIPAFRAEHGPLAFLTQDLPDGTPNTYTAASVLGPELLRYMGISAALYAAQLATHPHVHAAIPLTQVPTHCPICGGELRPGLYATHPGLKGGNSKVRPGFRCKKGCCHFSVAGDTPEDLRNIAKYLGGPADARSWDQSHSISEQLDALELWVTDGQGIQMKGNLSRSPKYPATATPVEVLIRRAARRARRALTRTNRRATLCAARTRRAVIAVDFVGKRAARFWNEVHRTPRNPAPCLTVRRSPRPVSPVPCKASCEETGPPRRN